MAWNPKNAYKRICFTVNLPDGKTHGDYDLDGLRTRLNPNYMICGRETGGEKGRPHFQGYLEFPKKKLGSAMDSAFRKTFPLPISCHYECARGTAVENDTYCSKEDKDPFRFGEHAAGQGERTDLAGLAQMAKEGKTDEEMLESNPGGFLVHQKGLGRIREIFKPVRTAPPKILVLWGPTGTGKSAAAYEVGYQGLDSVSIRGGRFLQGYKGKEIVLFDDFDWQGMQILDFMKLTDRYPVHFEIKGSECNFNPSTMIFTSNYDPMTEWWPKENERTREAFIRRLTEFGEIRFMGDEIPRGQKPPAKLTDFFGVKPAVAASSSGAGAGGAAAIDLTESSDDELSHYVGKRKVRDDDEHSERSNRDYHDGALGSAILKRAATVRPATKCRTCWRVLKKTAKHHGDGTGSCKNCD